MDYLLKASAIIAIFYGFYKLILQRETFFQSNRWFLLIGILSAILIPLIIIPIYVEQTPVSFQNVVFTDAATINETVVATPIDWMQLLTLIYIAGILFFGSKFIVNFLSLGNLLINHPKQKSENYYLIETQQNSSPFSFFRFIVYNPNKFKNNELIQIIVHEKVHAYQFHSIDILVSQITTILFWFNPIVWLYKKELEQNLEFIADDLAQQKSACEKSYQQLLLKTSISKNQLALTNNFYNSFIKKRIIMLHKNRSKNTNQYKFALILPFIAAFIFTFNTKVIAQTKESNESKFGDVVVVDYELIEILITKDTSEKELEKIKQDFSKKGLNLKFKGVKRNSKGEITAIKIDTSTKQSSGNYSAHGDEPIKTVLISFDSESSNYTIGNAYTSEILDKKGDGVLKIGKNGQISYEWDDGDGDGDGDGEVKIIGKNNAEIIITNSDKKTLYIIDVKESTKEDLEKLNADKIESVRVLKGEDATKKYGDKGKDGVVEISTKKANGKVLFPHNDNDPLWQNSDKKPLVIIDGKESKKSIEDLNADEIESMNVLKGESAIKKYGDKGKDGVVEVTTKKVKDVVVIGYATADGKRPLYYIDGKESIQKDLENLLSSDKIESIKELKGDAATKKYGDKGKDGVVEVTTKKE